MKNPRFCILTLLTVSICAFLLGFFLGRQTGTVQLQIGAEVAQDPVRITSPSAPTENSENSFPINVNISTAQQLTALPGIGEVLADRIITYREQYGDFISLEELMDVPGISQKRFDAIKDLITIGG